jgi:ATP-dependent RNA helicase DDX51/DBP6
VIAHIDMAGCEGGRLREALQEAGIEALFPVQVAVWNQVLGPGERDLCVCSPTGSGKTLSFALPIVQLLSTRVLRRLRALVVLPTRDLAVQVKSVFDILAPAVGLSVGLVGQSTVAAEASELVKSKSRMIHSFGSQVSSTNTPVFESCVDILVATPGRFMDHLKGTPGFTVEHLQYLVSIFFCTAR